MKKLLLSLGFLGFFGCEDGSSGGGGGSTDSGSCSFGEIGCGLVSEADGSGTVSLDLSGKTGTYIISPYALGNTSTVEGGSDQQLVFNSNLSLSLSSQIKADDSQISKEQNIKNRILLEKSIYNRFSKDSFETRSFQGLLDAHEAASSGLNLSDDSLRGKLKDILDKESRDSMSGSLKLAATCSSGSLSTTLLGAINVVVENEVQGSYCSLAQSGYEVGEDSVQSAMAKIVSGYKEIYDTTFPTAGGLEFIPTFVFANLPDGYLGVFDRNASEDLGRPVLLLDANYDDDQKIAGTIAHELQHAISYYYKTKVASGSLEIVSIDEGIAHFFQDVFGDGQTNYQDYVSEFDGFWTQANVAVMVASENDLSAANLNRHRGGTASFFYYLAGTQGAFSPSSAGYVSGSGVDYIASYVKSSNKGMSGLDNYLGGNLVRKFGEYGVAMIVSGTEAASSDRRFSFSGELSSLDPFGETSTFGYKPNQSSDKVANYTTWYNSAESTTFEMPYYTFMPRYVEGGEDLEFSLSDLGVGAFAVRIK